MPPTIFLCLWWYKAHHQHKHFSHICERTYVLRKNPTGYKSQTLFWKIHLVRASSCSEFQWKTQLWLVSDAEHRAFYVMPGYIWIFDPCRVWLLNSKAEAIFHHGAGKAIKQIFSCMSSFCADKFITYYTLSKINYDFTLSAQTMLFRGWLAEKAIYIVYIINVCIAVGKNISCICFSGLQIDRSV